MKKTVVVLAVLILGAGLAQAQDAEAQDIASQDVQTEDPCLFEVEGIQILEVAMLDSIVGGRQICDTPDEKPYVDKSSRESQNTNRDGPSKNRDNYTDPARYAVSAPLAGAMRVTSPTGQRNLNIGGIQLSSHAGTDLAASVGASVSMVKTGIVEKLIKTDLYGGVVTVRNVDGSISTYMHVVAAAGIKQGSMVSSGTRIASIGRSGVAEQGGTLSTGPHLHYQEADRYGNPISTSALFDRLYDPHYTRR